MDLNCLYLGSGECFPGANQLLRIRSTRYMLMVNTGQLFLCKHSGFLAVNMRLFCGLVILRRSNLISLEWDVIIFSAIS